MTKRVIPCTLQVIRHYGGLDFMGISTSHLIIVLLIVLVLFGAGKIPKIMGDLAKGVKVFKEGMKEKDEDKN